MYLLSTSTTKIKHIWFITKMTKLLYYLKVNMEWNEKRNKKQNNKEKGKELYHINWYYNIIKKGNEGSLGQKYIETMKQIIKRNTDSNINLDHSTNWRKNIIIRYQ